MSAGLTFFHIELARAHAEFLPLLPRRQPGSLAPETPQQLTLQPHAVAVLRDALEAGHFQSGILFGYRRGPRLDLQQAHRGGYRDQDGMFIVDPPYLLGLTDAYRRMDPDMDWAAQWLILPGGRRWDALSRLKWLTAARTHRAISSLHPLVHIFWAEGVLMAEAVINDDEAYVILDVTLQMT